MPSEDSAASGAADQAPDRTDGSTTSTTEQQHRPRVRRRTIVLDGPEWAPPAPDRRLRAWAYRPLGPDADAVDALRDRGFWTRLTGRVRRR